MSDFQEASILNTLVATDNWYLGHFSLQKLSDIEVKQVPLLMSTTFIDWSMGKQVTDTGAKLMFVQKGLRRYDSCNTAKSFQNWIIEP